MEKLQIKSHAKYEALEKKEQSLEALRDDLQQKERSLSRLSDQLRLQEVKSKNFHEQLLLQLEHTANMTKEEARQSLFLKQKSPIRIKNGSKKLKKRLVKIQKLKLFL